MPQKTLLIATFVLTASPLFAQDSATFTTSDGVKIHYLTMGSRGSWVVLIHGYADTAQRMWFTTGIAPVLAKRHRVVALNNRNHGQTDKPVPNGPSRAQDVVELMDHLKIAKAHIHGYSMGGGLTAQLLAMIPQRFITAGFGGSGIAETDPAFVRKRPRWTTRCRKRKARTRRRTYAAAVCRCDEPIHRRERRTVTASPCNGF